MDAAEVALKYFDFARAEILNRTKSSNDTLIVYAGAVGAILAWLYKASVDAPNCSQSVLLVRADLFFPTMVVISFLSLVASWIIYQNEAMISALAKYQKNILAKSVKGECEKCPQTWEDSDELLAADGRLFTFWSTVVYALLVVGPSILGFFEMWSLRHTVPHSMRFILIASVTTIVAVVMMCRLIRERWILRKPKSERRDSDVSVTTALKDKEKLGQIGEGSTKRSDLESGDR
jgi:hypothetical protein